MRIAHIDFEDVLIAQASSIEDLSVTSQGKPDYPVLMRWRINHLRKHGRRLRYAQAIVAGVQPFP